MERAERHRPSVQEPTATGFADWVYDLCHPGRNPDGERARQSRKRSRFCEKDIEDFRQRFNKLNRHKLGRWWTLEFSDPLDGTAQPFLASSLIVQNSPVRCVPDVVLRNVRTKEILIIERKVTIAKLENIPDEGWPNLRAQLWCYRWIDKWLEAPKLTLIAEIWQTSIDAESISKTDFYPCWDRDDRKLHDQSLALFRKYGGSFSPRINT